tara:strand:+ start:4355 stop:4633 length:279 start_codon:yes stop_codon:yes gene_type:complete
MENNTTQMPYYKQINNVKYDRNLLSAALKMMSEDRNLQISEDNIKKLCNMTKDGGKITDCEKDTLNYIKNNYDLTADAKLFCVTFLITLEQV